MSFDTLQEKIIARKNPTVAGLDPKPEYVPAHILKDCYARYGETLEGAAEAVYRFNRGLMDALCDVVPAVKPQAAYYERLGWRGMEVMERTIAYAHGKGLFVIADIKRGDIAKTAEMYAKAHFEGDFEADFITLAPYMGLDSIRPYLPYVTGAGKGLFVLVRTSNPGAKDFEYEKLADGHVYDMVGDKLHELGGECMGEKGYSSLGLVIGGTHIEEAAEIRARYEDSFFLIPGYGAQGGTADDIARYLDKHSNGGVVNSSRAVLLAYKKQPGVAFDEAARNECIKMKEAIAHACNSL